MDGIEKLSLKEEAMTSTCTHPVSVVERGRTATPTATHFSASDCGGYPIPQPSRQKITGCAGTRRPVHAVSVFDRSRLQAPTSSYWGPQDCGGGSEPRPSGYKSNDFCERRMIPQSPAMHAVKAQPIRRGVSDYSAPEDCGCSQNATGNACW